MIALGAAKEPRLIAVIECFFDDSGKESNPTNRFVVIAGYIAVTERWGKFQEIWRHALIKHELRHVHMKEILGIAKSRNWDMPKLNSVLRDFIGAIKESDLIGFGVAVDADEWRKLSPERRFRFGDAQEFCCSRILRRVRDRLNAAGLGKEPMAVVFDQDFELARRRLKLIEHVRKGYPDLSRSLAQLCFADAEQFHPLQAADMLAWNTRRELVNQSEGKKSHPAWEELMTALPYGSLDYAAGEFWDKNAIERELPSDETAKAAADPASSSTEQDS